MIFLTEIMMDTSIVINYDNILQVIDSFDSVGYSIRFILEDSPKVSFLILLLEKMLMESYQNLV